MKANRNKLSKKVLGYIYTFHTLGERLAAAQLLTKTEILKLLNEGDGR